MAEYDHENPKLQDFATVMEGLQANLKCVEELMDNCMNSQNSMDIDPLNLTETYTQWLHTLQQDPQKICDANVDFLQKSYQITQQFVSGMSCQQQETSNKEKNKDPRFRHEQWTEHPVFNSIMDGYLLASDWLRSMATENEGLDDHTAEKVRFYTEQFIDAMSPTNFAVTNPSVIEKTLETNGANLVDGMKNLLQDLEDDGQLHIRMTDMDAFSLGENIAVTPGKVIFQNRMFQLIQYSATTENVLKRPLLVVPPWINKFYIMDLQPKNSLLKWYVDQGHTVFVISWVNPDEKYADTGFDAYLSEGILTAVEVVEQVTGESEMNSVGYCLGGTLLAITAAYMASKGDARIQSITCFTTMLDFSEPGDLGVFIDEEQIQGVENKMAENGYLDGRAMSGVFNMLRANDLIWSFYVNNYLLGNDPRPFDLLYWNSDSTRMPAKMHSWYLRNMYLENKLREPGGITIDNVAIDLSSITTPACFVSAMDDHIAPWKSTYAGAKLFSGKVCFILGDSGHIAGVINPPAKNKYGYRVTDSLPKDAEEWAQEAKVVEGSWWTEWDKWVRSLSDDADRMVAARKEGGGVYDAIEDAPGTYVKCTTEEATPVVDVTELKSPEKAYVTKPADGKAITKKTATPTKPRKAAAKKDGVKISTTKEAILPHDTTEVIVEEETYVEKPVVEKATRRKPTTRRTPHARANAKKRTARKRRAVSTPMKETVNDPYAAKVSSAQTQEPQKPDDIKSGS